MYVLIIKRIKKITDEDEIYEEVLANFMLRTIVISIVISILCSLLEAFALFVAFKKNASSCSLCGRMQTPFRQLIDISSEKDNSSPYIERNRQVK